MKDDPSNAGRIEPLALAKEILNEAELLVGQHARLLRAEVSAELRELARAAVPLGAGTGLCAAGGLLSTLMLVHALSRATRWPLWVCYGAVGALLGASGASLVRRGARHAARIRLCPPPHSAAALEETLQWLKAQVH
jgi:hypothetical protein